MKGHPVRAPGRPLIVQHVIHALGDGGADRALTHLVTHADPRVVRHRILALAPGPGHAALPPHVRVDTLAGKPDLAAAVNRLMTARRPPPQVVHGWVSFPSVVAAAFSAATGTPLVLRQPTNIEQELRWNADGVRGCWAELQAAFALADCVIVPSPVLEAGTRRVYGVQRVVTIPNGVETDVPSRWTAGARRGRRRVVLALVGRLAEQKNPLLLLRALSLIGDDIDWELRVYGEGPLRLPMEASLSARGFRSRVTFLGFRHDWRRDAASLDAFVFPTRFEGMSNGLLEAAAAGLPIVATDIPENRYLLGPQGALFARPDDAAGLAASIRRVVTDEGLAAQLSVAASAVSGRFTIAAMVQAHETVYHEVARDPGEAHQARNPGHRTRGAYACVL